MLAIKNAQVVILDYNQMVQEGALPINSDVKVTILEPQKQAIDHVIKLYKLNEEQARAFLIITEHLDDESNITEGNTLKIKRKLIDKSGSTYVHHFPISSTLQHYMSTALFPQNYNHF